MAKFKVGDRVRATAHTAWYALGSVGTVKEDNSRAPWVDWDGIGTWAASEDELELLPAADATGKPAFKVGDRVRVIRDGSSPKGSGHGVNIGHTFTVRIDEDGDITDGEWFFYPDELSLCEELTPLTIETGKFYRTRDGRKVGPAYRHHDGWGMGSEGGKMWAKDGHRYFGNAPETDLIAEWVDEPAGNDNAPSTKPAIVALIENGQPKPSEKPKVHKSEVCATDEAERLAVKYPGQKFGVFVLADSRIADVVIRRAA
ncbi:hypothetical protein [Brucella intermedia]|uniref:hypothetical protein n=1 Tax=Brucella intermedia TaxID=94625 RepID=UPI00224B5B29|nr:hypothetical protein [Brucella intermedia]